MPFRFTGFADEAGNDLDTQFRVVKEAGWNSIEARKVDTSHICDLSDDEWVRVWDRFQAEGVSLPSFGGQIANWARTVTSDFQQDIDELRRVAPRMKQTGAVCLRIMSYPNDEDNPLPVADWKKEVIRRLSELAKIAEGEGVVLGHENCSGYGGIGPNEYLELAEAVDSPALKVIFDTGNNSVHENDLEASWRYYEGVKDHIVHVHIKSYKPGPEGKLVTCYPEEDPNQKRILADLKKRGYDGWISIEPHLKAAIHEGRSAEDNAAYAVWLEYTRRLERLAAEVEAGS